MLIPLATKSEPVADAFGEDRRLHRLLLEVPPGTLRDRLLLTLTEIAAFVREPRCAEMQADGVPCPSATTACEQCRRVEQVLDQLRTRVREA